MSRALLQQQQVDSFLSVNMAKDLLDTRKHNLREFLANCLLT